MKLLWDGHGLSPYWGVVSVFDPDHDEDLPPFEAVGETWEVQSAKYWEGKIAPPDGQDHIDGGMNEYSYSLEALDETGEKDVTIQFRPGLPNAEHIDTEEQIQGMPDDLPESIRVQVMGSNVEVAEALDILRVFADEIGLNREYFAGAPHEYSRLHQYERYVRLRRDVSEDHVVGSGGIIDQLADFMSGESGRGSYTWDNEEIVGHYLSVESDADTWSLLLPGDRHGARLKNYHPKHPRASGGEDPLTHPKVEVSLSNEYDVDGNIPLSALDEFRDELDETMLNVLHWSGVPLAADSGAWVTADQYFAVDERDEPVELVENPLPELREKAEKLTESELIRAELSDTQEEVLTALADGGQMHYETLADEADAGTSTVYRLVDNISALLDTDDGIVRFADEVTRRCVESILDQVRQTAVWGSESLRQVAQENGILRDDGPLQRWMSRHGIRLVRQHPELELEVDRPVGEVEIRQILRAGLDAAECSGLLTRRFENGTISFRTRDGAERNGWQIVVDGDVLGDGALRNLR